MIRQGSVSSLRSGAIQITDFNNQCPLDLPDAKRLSPLSPIDFQLDKKFRSRNNSILRFTSESRIESTLNNYKELGTVRNEELFSMMNSQQERERLEYEKKNYPNLSKIMGGLQTYKDKQNKQNPNNRVHIPYYHRVIARNKYSVSTQDSSSQAVMFSK